MNRHDIKEQVGKLLQETKLSHTKIGKLFNVSRGSIFLIQKELGILREDIRIKNKKICLSCNKLFLARGKSVTRPNRGKYCSKLCYTVWQKSQQNKGSNHPNWKETTRHEKEIHSIRHSPEWRIWRTTVFTRDNFRCKFCDSTKKLEPHHIHPRRDRPDLVFDLFNGITLCRSCHALTIKREYDYIERCIALI